VKLVSLPHIKDLPKKERTSSFRRLLRTCKKQQENIQELEGAIVLLKEQIQKLKDEIAILKKQKPRPNIKPSTLEKEEPKASENGTDDTQKRPGSSKRSKTKDLEIHETIPIPPENIPEGSYLKDYEEYTVQDLKIQPHNTVYQLERWITPDGQTLWGKLPKEIGNGHFGPTLISYILYQHYHSRVPEPLIWEELIEFGIDISAGHISYDSNRGKRPVSSGEG
jgi:hypothetical protein